MYVVDRQDQRALIQDGPFGDATKLSSPDSQDLTALFTCWEYDIIRAKESEQKALQRNADEILRLLGTYTRPPGRLLDFGCGAGFFLAAARTAGWECLGLEPLAGHATYARTKLGLEVRVDTLRDDTFPADYFDVITAFQVFEHLPNLLADGQRLARMLKPRGLLLVEVPNIDTWSVRLFGERHRHFVQDHLTFFSARTLSRFMSDLGLEVQRVFRPWRRMTVGHLVGVWVSRFLPSRGQTMLRMAQRMGLSDRVIAANAGDIVAVIARKRGST